MSDYMKMFGKIGARESRMDDLISRQTAIEAIASRDETNGTVKVFTGREVNGILSELPTARENVRGKWWHEPYNSMWIQRCSNCFQTALITGEEECPYNYCPLCGADMRGGQHD